MLEVTVEKPQGINMKPTAVPKKKKKYNNNNKTMKVSDRRGKRKRREMCLTQRAGTMPLPACTPAPAGAMGGASPTALPPGAVRLSTGPVKAKQ